MVASVLAGYCDAQCQSYVFGRGSVTRLVSSCLNTVGLAISRGARHVKPGQAASIAVLALAAQLLQAGPAQAAETGRGAPSVVQAESVPVAAVASHYVKPTPVASWQAPKPSWPSGSAEVSLAGTTPAVAGALPVTLARSVSAAAESNAAKSPSGTTAIGSSPAKAAVAVEPQSLSTAADVNGVLFTVARADGVAETGSVQVSVSYKQFKDAFGGDWAQRLALVELPACALTTPNTAACRVQHPVSYVNHGATQTLSATVTLPAASGASASGGTSSRAASAATGSETSAQPLVLAVTSNTQSSSTSGGGDYTATSLKASGSWSAGGSTDAFNWSYPIAVPQVPGSLTPSLALSYNSQSVDGLTSATNNQAGVVGDGWVLNDSYIERSYSSCHQNPAGSTQTWDNCWSSKNQLTIDLNGQTSTLIKDDASGDYHPQNDTNERVTYQTGASNGAQNGEYFIVTTSDGTQYYFGLDELPGYVSTDTNDAKTNSVDTEPVYSTALGQPCYNATFSKSYCEQAYRWNLDYVVDAHSDAESYWYTTSTGFYAQDLGSTAPATSVYTRDSLLSKIEYGQRAGQVYSTTPAGEILITANGRCNTSTTGCATSTLSSSTASKWPDTPYDLNCASGASCTSQSPSFWSENEVTGIETEALVGSTLTPVDSWALTYAFPAITGTGDTTTPSLWLSTITHKGLDTSAEPSGGSALSSLSVTFKPTAMQNRVNLSDGYPWITRSRLTEIDTETGEKITVGYSAAACGSGTPSNDAQNTSLCYPVYWYPDVTKSPTRDYFNVFIVKAVTEDDTTGGFGNDTIVTSYTPVGNPAWHYDDNPLVPSNQVTWDQFRGYQGMAVSVGTAPDPITNTQYSYFQGMDGDYLSSTSTRTATVADSRGDSPVDDLNQYTGMTYETQVFNGSAQVTDTISTPWTSSATATHALTGGVPSQQSFMTGTAQTRVYTPLAGGSARETETDYTHDSYGRVTQVDDLGDVTRPSQNLCTTTSYADNTSAWILDKVAETKTVSVNCSTTPAYPADAVSDELTFYDGSTTLGASPTAGDVTETEKAASYTGSTPTSVMTAESVYDEYGRATSATDADSRVTKTAYTPATGAEPTSIVVTDPMGLATTTVYDPLRELPTQATTPAGYVTIEQYDALGRLTAVFKPGFPTTGPANLKFTYTVSAGGPSAVDTYTLNDDETYRLSETLYDSMLRAREVQAQTADGGRDITDTYYNTDGWKSEVTNSYYNSSAVSTILEQAQVGTVPSAIGYTYDGDGRQTAQTAYALGSQTWQTTYSYGGDFVTTVPPAGGTAETTVTDARGNQTDLIQYLAGEPTDYVTDPASDYTDTKYTYYASGKHSSETDAAGNQWTWTYNLLGDQTGSSDPDTGTVTTAYDNAGQLKTSTDARGKQATYVYDEDGRQTAEYDTTATSTLSSSNEIASWSYDTLEKGYLTSSTSYSNGDTYTAATMGYNAMGEPEATKYTLTGTDAGLLPSGGYTVSDGYTFTGLPAGHDDPAIAGLPEENQTIGYDEFGQPTSLKGAGGVSWTYVSAIGYTEYNQVAQYTMPTVSGTVWAALSYDPQTQALDNVQTTDSTTSPVVDNLQYTYGNASGTVSKGAGLLTQTTDSQDGTAVVDTQCFTYDYAQRLSQAWTATDNCAATPSPGSSSTVGGADAPYWQSWTYDAAGDRLTQVDHDTSGDTANDTTTTYNYPTAGSATDQPTTLTNTTATGPDATSDSASFTYDASGNETAQTGGALGSQSYVWNDQGKLQSTTTSAGATNYVYDADGNQILRRDPGSTTLDVGDAELTLTGGSLTGVRYYSIGGASIAERTSTGVVSVLIPDRQGTDQLAIDIDAAQAVARRQYLPFGQTRGAAVAWVGGDKSYVGGDADASTGLETLGARVYSTTDGRFLSVDPVFEAQDPNQLGGYDYAGNDPATGSDPNGEMFWVPGVGGCGNLQACEHQSQEVTCANNPAAPGCPGIQFTNPSTNSALFGPIVFSSAMPDYNKRLKQNQPAYDIAFPSMSDHGVLNRLKAYAAGATELGYSYSVTLLNYWLSGQGGLLIMQNSALTSYYNVSAIKSQIDNLARRMMSGKSPGPSSFVSETSWQQVGTNKQSIIHTTTAGSISDWYLAMDDMDVRVAAYKPNANQIDMSFQVAKYYSFDHAFSLPFGLGFSPQQLEDLNTTGLAQNYYVVGQSANISIPAN